MPKKSSKKSPKTSAQGERSYLGIDVAGPRRGLFRATIHIDAEDLWTLQGLERFAHDVPEEEVGWSTPEGMEEVRTWVSQGRRGLTSLAEATETDCEEICTQIGEVLAEVSPEIVFVDAPAAFARNAVQHGRATEKANLSRSEHDFARQIPFQMSPSIATGMEHSGAWNWMIRGMMVFYAVRSGGAFDAEGWKDYLHQGWKAEADAGPKVVECMPTATVLALRSSFRHEDMLKELLGGIRANDEFKAVRVLEIVRAYLAVGVSATKRKAQLYDWADATVAALGCLAYERSDEFAAYSIAGDTHERWQSSERSVKSAHDQEGAIEVPLPKLA